MNSTWAPDRLLQLRYFSKGRATQAKGHTHRQAHQLNNYIYLCAKSADEKLASGQMKATVPGGLQTNAPQLLEYLKP
jgi:hypothetical protein